MKATPQTTLINTKNVKLVNSSQDDNLHPRTDTTSVSKINKNTTSNHLPPPLWMSIKRMHYIRPSPPNKASKKTVKIKKIVVVSNKTKKFLGLLSRSKYLIRPKMDVKRNYSILSPRNSNETIPNDVYW